MLVDRAVIQVRSGRGGAGAVHFARYKYIPKGGPDGGDGGDGGSVYLEAHPGIATLYDFTYRHHWQAEDGQPGADKQMAGKDGQDLVIRLPPGTLVYDEATGALIADLDTPGKRVAVARGGKRGFGNDHFKSATNQAPRFAEPGGEPEERTLRLELKLIADVGLVGKPNAGKSTLLSRISRARPRIAEYPFTTLEPQLGIAELPGERRMVVADIPGLIEGAHQGAGLGTQFLRHIERTRVLVHLLEAEPADGSDPAQNYRVVRRELAQHSPVLAEKPEIVVLTKIDLLSDERDRAAAVELIQPGVGRTILPLSAATGVGLGELLERCWALLHAPATPT